MHTGQQLHTKVINFYPSLLCMALCILGLLVDTNGLRCYIYTEKDCCETGDNPSLKVLMKFEYLIGNSLCVGV